MFKKIAVLAVVATVSLAMPHDFAATEADIPVHADFPMPVVPWDFEATAYTYLWSNGRLAPANEWSTQRWSSTLNKIYEVTGIVNDEGDEVASSIESTDATAGTAVEYNQGQACTNAHGLQVDPVNMTIATYFNQFAYAGVQYAPWELTRVKYHRLDGQGVQYFYKQSNLQLRFFVELTSETTMKIHDFASGLEAKQFTDADFVIAECSPAAMPFLQ